MTFRMGAAYPEYFNILVPIGSPSLPADDGVLTKWNENNVHLFFAIGKRDEFNDYEKYIAPQIPRLAKLKNCYKYIPEWVYNGDHGISSINFGIEMGQLCLINPMHCNLMFDDGTPMEKDLPDGILGWLNQAL